jgi:hypothetical protein
MADSKWGDDGGAIPDNERVTANVDLTVNFKKPVQSPLECGKRYSLYFSLEAKQWTNCGAHGDAEHLYRILEEIAEARVEQLQCPDNCKPLHKWVMRRYWKCSTIKSVGTIASICMGLLCPNKGDEKPGGLPALPRDEDFSSPNDETEDLEKINESFNSELEALRLRCPCKILVKFDYSIDVAKKVDNVDVQPIIKDAEARAAFYLNQIECRFKRLECETRWAIIRREWLVSRWKENESSVHVTLYIRIRCKLHFD